MHIHNCISDVQSGYPQLNFEEHNHKTPDCPPYLPLCLNRYFVASNYSRVKCVHTHRAVIFLIEFRPRGRLLRAQPRPATTIQTHESMLFNHLHRLYGDSGRGDDPDQSRSVRSVPKCWLRRNDTFASDLDSGVEGSLVQNSMGQVFQRAPGLRATTDQIEVDPHNVKRCARSLGKTKPQRTLQITLLR
jgi:hypothetical protein